MTAALECDQRAFIASPSSASAGVRDTYDQRRVQHRLTRQAFLDGEIPELASDLDPAIAALRASAV